MKNLISVSYFPSSPQNDLLKSDNFSCCLFVDCQEFYVWWKKKFIRNFRQKFAIQLINLINANEIQSYIVIKAFNSILSCEPKIYGKKGFFSLQCSF